jgi:predicted transcriptional regulator
MRQKQAKAQGTKREAISAEPLAEGPAKKQVYMRFSESELSLLVKARNELAAKGKNDRQIARLLAQETGRNYGSVETKILRLVKDGVLEPNPNRKKRFGEYEIETTIRRRTELEATGLWDAEISRRIADELGKNHYSVANLIHELVVQGRLPRNQHQKRSSRFSEDEVRRIQSLRSDLLSQHVSEKEIGRRIAAALGRNEGSVKKKIDLLVRNGASPQNPKKKRNREFTAEEMERIVSIRAGLLEKGLKDAAICRELATSLGRNIKSLDWKVRDLIRQGVVEENKNKSDGFPKHAERALLEKYGEFASAGMNDWQIARKLCVELGRSAVSVLHKLGRLRESGRLSANPNARASRPRGRCGSLSDRELVELASELHFPGKTALRRSDQGLYKAICERGLLGKVRFEKKVRVRRKWLSMPDSQLLSHARRFIKENKISGKGSLCRADGGLYGVLRKRGLLGKVGLREKLKPSRNWRFMGNDEIVRYATIHIQEQSITNRKALERCDPGLYSILARRGILSRVFADIEKAKMQGHGQALVAGLRQAAEAMWEFGEGK